MNYGEELAYWYFRLNGFFPLVRFVVHERPGRQSSDCDLVAVRPAYADEIIGGAAEVDPWLRDHMPAQHTLAVICEVKTGRRRANEVLPTQSIREAVGRIGLEADSDDIVHSLEQSMSADTAAGHRILKVLVAPRAASANGPFKYLSLEDANAFILKRMRAHSEKERDRHFFPSALLQYMIHFGTSVDPLARPR